ncbi:glycosyltransferase family 4 protein [Candidatus Uhrbacteria bacterium]|nr:glycosyltransferase family 4 protein [Candidatus Uhrbacteria bacterium]
MIGAKGIPASMALGGGIERHVEILSRRLAERGHNVSVYVRPYTNPKRRFTWSGVHLITLPTIRRKHLDAIVHTFLATIHVLFQNVDIIHYHAVGPATLAWIPRLFKWRSRVVVTFHGRDQFHEKWKWAARMYLAFGEWAACRFPHLTIAISHEIRLFCEMMYRRNAVYIPNGVEVPKRLPGTQHLKKIGLEPEQYLITLGRLIPVKAYEDAILAYKNLETDKKLLLIGDASYDSIEYQSKLERLAASDARVILMGRRTGEELEQLIAHCYAMIHPSRSEGLSIAILEALSYGRLVVMSDIPANRELVDHSGVAYPVGNVKKLQEVLQWVISDPVMVRLRGERGRDAVQKLYAWDRVVARTEQEYEQLFQTT